MTDIHEKQFLSLLHIFFVMVHLETVLLIWDKLISMQILIIIMPILADDEFKGMTDEYYYLLGINKYYGEWYTSKLFLWIAHNTAKLRITFHTAPLGSPINHTLTRLIEPN